MRIQQPGTTLMPQICTMCGAKYMGGPSALYCPSCREEKRKEYDRRTKERQRAGKSIVLGETVGICAKCGEKFIFQGSLQKYCKKCADVAIRENDRKKTRGWLKRTVKKHGRRYADERNEAKRVEKKTPHKCELCGVFLEGVHANRRYCDSCRDIRKKYTVYANDLKRRKVKPLSFDEWRKVPKKRNSKEVIKEWREKNPKGKKVACVAATGLNAVTVRKWWRILEDEAGIKRETSRERIARWRKENPKGRGSECAAAIGLRRETVYKWWKIIDEEE